MNPLSKLSQIQYQLYRTQTFFKGDFEQDFYIYIFLASLSDQLQRMKVSNNKSLELLQELSENELENQAI